MDGQEFFLLLASYVFYTAWNPPFVIPLWVSTVIDRIAAQRLVKAERQWTRRGWMLTSVIANLAFESNKVERKSTPRSPTKAPSVQF